MGRHQCTRFTPEPAIACFSIASQRVSQGEFADVVAFSNFNLLVKLLRTSLFFTSPFGLTMDFAEDKEFPAYSIGILPMALAAPACHAGRMSCRTGPGQELSCL